MYRIKINDGYYSDKHPYQFVSIECASIHSQDQAVKIVDSLKKLKLQAELESCS